MIAKILITMLMNQRINWDKINVMKIDVIAMDLEHAALVDSVVGKQEIGIEELH